MVSGAKPSGGGEVVLVVGGAGFIGSHLVDRLVKAGREVRILDLLHPLAHSGKPDYLNPDAEYVWGDVRDAETVRRCLEDVGTVSHQAAMVGLGSEFRDVADYVSHNDLGTATLLGEMHGAGFGGRLVLAGSMVVYGEGGYRCAEHGDVHPAPRARERLEAGRFEPPCPICGADLEPQEVTEDAPIDPRNVYAATKLHQEHLCAALARESGCGFTALRYHNVYGPRMPRDTPYAGVASIFRSSLESGEAPSVFEDGHQLRDFVHVSDVVAANEIALADQAPTGVFNIASGSPRSVGEMAEALSMAMDGSVPARTGEFRLGDVRHVFASIGRARADLGYEPQITLSSGMTEFATAPLRAPSSPG